MKSTTFALASLLASAAIAQPHRHEHRHAARHQRRDQEVVWVTEVDYVTETIDVTTTIWVSEGFQPPTTTSVATTSTESSPSSVAASSSGVPAQFFEPDTALPTSTFATSTTSTTPVYIASTPSSIYVAPVSEAAPIQSTTSTTPVYVAPAPVVEPSSPAAQVYTQPAAVSTTTSAAAAAIPTKPSTSSGSSTGECSPDSPCAGDITFYEAGLGACGITSDGTVDRVVALPYGLMGTQSNGNPYCGKTITIKCDATGKTTTAVVTDKCMGCKGYSIDLSNIAFGDLDSFDVGRTTATWWFN